MDGTGRWNAVKLLVLGTLLAVCARDPVIVEVPEDLDVENIAPLKNVSFQVYIVTFMSRESPVFCGGAVIESHHVLTAATCVGKPNSRIKPKVNVIVQYGDPLEPNHASFDVVTETFYERREKERVDADIVILQVDRPILPEDMPPAVPLQTKKRFRSKNCTLASSPATKKPKYKGEYGFKFGPPTPMWYLESVPWKRCFTLDNTHRPHVDLLCIGKRQKFRNTCEEEPGTPVVCDGLLTGVVSGSRGCGKLNFAYLYTDVGYYWQWINATLQMHAQKEVLGAGAWERFQQLQRFDEGLPTPRRRRLLRPYNQSKTGNIPRRNSFVSGPEKIVW